MCCASSSSSTARGTTHRISRTVSSHWWLCRLPSPADAGGSATRRVKVAHAGVWSEVSTEGSAR